MKNFILGALLTLTISIVANTCWMATKHGKFHSFCFFLKEDVFGGDYLVNPFTGRCSTDVKDNRGISEADYFGCDKFQRLINIK